MKVAALGLATLAAGKVYFSETFDDSWEDRWVHSSWKEKDGTAGTFETSAGKWHIDEEENKGLFTPKDSRFYTVAAPIESFSNKGLDKLIIQYQLKYEKELECGGGYLKIGPKLEDLSKFEGETGYNIMFGPDKCGYQKRTHLIFENKGKNILKTTDLEYKQDDIGVSSLYTLTIKKDNTVSVKVDNKEIYEGRLEDGWELLEPAKIPDPEEKKPKDWVDEAMIDDPEDKKPEDWVEEEKIADPEAKKPEDWNEDEDGEWEPGMIDNPKYKGPWSAKRIANPAYKGPWKAKEIKNPDYVADPELYAYDDFGFVGVDVWQVKSGAIFDNIIITDDEKEAAKFAAKWEKLVEYEKEQKQEEATKKVEEKADGKKENDLDIAADADDMDDDEDL